MSRETRGAASVVIVVADLYLTKDTGWVIRAAVDSITFISSQLMGMGQRILLQKTLLQARCRSGTEKTRSVVICKFGGVAACRATCCVPRKWKRILYCVETRCSFHF